MKPHFEIRAIRCPHCIKPNDAGCPFCEGSGSIVVAVRARTRMTVSGWIASIGTLLILAAGFHRG